MPGFTLTGQVAHVVASDNREVIERLSEDPLTIHATRVDTVRGLVNLMDAALAAAPHFHAPALFMYGGKDELIPDKATTATCFTAAAGAGAGVLPGRLPFGCCAIMSGLCLIDYILCAGIQAAWMNSLPSGADGAATAWLAQQK